TIFRVLGFLSRTSLGQTRLLGSISAASAVALPGASRLPMLTFGPVFIRKFLLLEQRFILVLSNLATEGAMSPSCLEMGLQVLSSKLAHALRKGRLQVKIKSVVSSTMKWEVMGQGPLC